METPLLIALSHQGALRRRLDVIANNIANMDTIGFKAQRMMFQEYLVRSRGGEQVLGDRLSFVHDVATARDVSEGPLRITGNPLDLAVKGEGFFAVETASGVRFTRNGRFRIDDSGQLVTEHGHPVQAQGGGPIPLGTPSADIAIGRDGTISVDGEEVTRLRVVRFERPHDMRLVAGGLMASDETPEDIQAPEILQGMLEGSNVQPILQMAEMIEVHRAYDGVRNLIDQEHNRIKKMVEEYARPA